jgi:hypothetical protein
LTIETNESSSLPSAQIIEQSTENTENIEADSIHSRRESSVSQMDLIEPADDEQIHLETNSEMDQQVELEQQQENLSENQNELIIDLSIINNETTLSPIENKNIKRKRRRLRRFHLTVRKRNQKRSKTSIQWWINKYSIEPISIILHRINLPTD